MSSALNCWLSKTPVSLLGACIKFDIIYLVYRTFRQKQVIRLENSKRTNFWDTPQVIFWDITSKIPKIRNGIFKAILNKMIFGYKNILLWKFIINNLT